jgi:hypothetical protein
MPGWMRIASLENDWVGVMPFVQELTGEEGVSGVMEIFHREGSTS